MRSMMIVVAAVAVWMGLVVGWPEPTILATVILGGPVTGVLACGRDRDLRVAGIIAGGVVGFVSIAGFLGSILGRGGPAWKQAASISLVAYSLGLIAVYGVFGAMRGAREASRRRDDAEP
ncbi:hypothetical protein [Paludisphaera mucosa]|uniref:Uncharacterized protein n=1 Tax=Paludisphaera mucosa TaxID=3030827 RepID=A0ABT6FKJ7_9BACT|nr:hypothetical protein [Paludisphaera mucosa]MDG3008085.1 hypothetical protein [Paludisphaera mucosa]